MKNKKFLTIIAAVVLSGMLLTAGALAANPAGSAYEQFKQLLNGDQVRIDNASVDVSMSVTDNRQLVLALYGNMKRDSVSDRMSGTFNITGKEKTESLEVYCNSEEVLFRLAGSDNWYRTTHGNGWREEERVRRYGRDAEGWDGKDKQLRDVLFDTVMGDYRDQFSVTESNGFRTFTLSFDEGNMPILLQAFFQLSDSGINYEIRDEYDENDNLDDLPQELRDALSRLKEQDHDIELVEKKLKSLEMTFTVDQQDRFTGIGIATVCTGKDAEGTVHELEIDLSVSLTDIGTTVADEANPDPASVTVIENDIFMNAGRRAERG